MRSEPCYYLVEKQCKQQSKKMKEKPSKTLKAGIFLEETMQEKSSRQWDWRDSEGYDKYFMFYYAISQLNI